MKEDEALDSAKIYYANPFEGFAWLVIHFSIGVLFTGIAVFMAFVEKTNEPLVWLKIAFMFLSGCVPLSIVFLGVRHAIRPMRHAILTRDGLTIFHYADVKITFGQIENIRYFFDPNLGDDCLHIIPTKKQMSTYKSQPKYNEIYDEDENEELIDAEQYISYVLRLEQKSYQENLRNILQDIQDMAMKNGIKLNVQNEIGNS